MKELKVLSGGHPLTNEDAQWLQTATQEAIAGLAAVGADGPTKISGVEVIFSGSQVTVTEGWIIWNTTLYRVVPVANFTVPSGSFLVFRPAVLGSGTYKTYLNQAQVDCYEDRVLQVTTRTAIGDTSVIYEQDLNRFGAYRWSGVGGSGISQIPYGNGWGLHSPTGSGLVFENLRYRREWDRVYVDGCFANTVNVPPGEVFTLPVDHRPRRDKIFPGTNSVGDQYRIIVQSSGGVFITGLALPLPNLNRDFHIQASFTTN